MLPTKLGTIPASQSSDQFRLGLVGLAVLFIEVRMAALSTMDL